MAPEQFRRVKSKLQQWLSRYLPLELASIVTAVAGGMAAAQMTSEPITVAYAAAWSENIGYYGFAFTRELRQQSRVDQTLQLSNRAIASAKILVWEFGLAELLDSFIVRPLTMLASITLFGHLQGGIIAGKVIADTIFYAIAIVFYERRKQRAQRPSIPTPLG